MRWIFARAAPFGSACARPKASIIGCRAFIAKSWRPERLVFTHVWLDAQGKPGKETLVTITLAEHGGKTELTLHQTGFKSVESRDGHRGGWTSTLDRLAEYLAKA
jgi:uncharacterized protein YndB with AHSA1/START domain